MIRIMHDTSTTIEIQKDKKILKIYEFKKMIAFYIDTFQN